MHMGKKTKKSTTKAASGDEITEGDVLRIHMTGRVNSHEGPVFQVTDEEVARAEGMMEDEEYSMQLR